MSDDPRRREDGEGKETTNDGLTLGGTYNLEGVGSVEVTLIDGDRVVLEPPDLVDERPFVLPDSLVPSASCQQVE